MTCSTVFVATSELRLMLGLRRDVGIIKRQ